jgi:NAD(P)-dependent dehydrogenase (short-subunit alcohol dehydrogenase family)
MTTVSGKVALVTGGTSGIGLATAAAFVARGASVVIVARDPVRGARALATIGGPAGAVEFVRADVADADQVERLVARTVERFGRLDYAVNNAGSGEAGMNALTADLSDSEFDRAMALNFRSVWLCMKHELTQFVRQGSGGAIVNVSSVNGLGGVPGAAPYAAAKAGIIALAKSAAMEYAGHGIRVNAFVAGAYDTPLLRSAMAAAHATEDAYAARIPLHRIGQPAEAAATIVWLCSDESSYVTGHTMIGDGGLTAWAR